MINTRKEDFIEHYTQAAMESAHESRNSHQIYSDAETKWEASQEDVIGFVDRLGANFRYDLEDVLYDEGFLIDDIATIYEDDDHSVIVLLHKDCAIKGSAIVVLRQGWVNAKITSIGVLQQTLKAEEQAEDNNDPDAS